MSAQLDDADLRAARALVVEAIAGPRWRPEGKPGLQMVGPIEILLLHILIPLFVGVTSSLLAERLKGRSLRSLSRKEATAVLEELKARPVNPRAEPDEESMRELRVLLGPFGLDDAEIRALQARVNERARSNVG